MNNVKYKLLSIIPDKWYLELKYLKNFGKLPNLTQPTSFNEKLLWLMLYDRDPKFTKMVDKYEAKMVAEALIGEEHVVPTFGVWKHFNEIDFDSLPNQFVLKCTHDSGGLVICRDKNKLNLNATKRKIEKCLKTDFYRKTREWQYKNVPPRIIAEKFLNDGRGRKEGLTDYKFFCFNGEVKFLYVSQDLDGDHKYGRMSFFDLDGNRMPFRRSDFNDIEKFVIPDCFDKMKEIAKLMAKKLNLPFIRIDLYEVNGQVYFSEFTFSPCGAMLPFEPREWDRKLGDWIKL